MLGVFQQVAKAIGNEEVGRLATFDLMFEGIEATLKPLSPAQSILPKTILGILSQCRY